MRRSIKCSNEPDPPQNRRGQATAQEVLEELPEAPSYSAVRALLRLMEEKGYLRHQKDGPRYLYRGMQAREKARKSALRNLLRTFFANSAAFAIRPFFN